MSELTLSSGIAVEPRPLVRWRVVIAAWVAALLVAVVFAFVLRQAGDWSGAPWEMTLLERSHVQLPSWLDALFLVLPWFGTNVGLLPVSIVAAIWLRWRARRPDLALHVLVVQLGAFALTHAGKMLFGRPRPELWELRGQFAGSAFPSGHAVVSVAVLFTFAVLLQRERGWRWPYAVASVMLVISLFSRLYLGVHWPSDVIVGVVMGLIWLIGTLRAFPPRVVDRSTLGDYHVPASPG